MDITNWLLIRGLAREARHWGEFPNMLQEEAPKTIVHFLELPGVGKKVNSRSHTRIEDYTDELREEWLYLKDKFPGKWNILAISMGGMIGMDWCHRYPEDIGTLVLINSSAGNLSLPHHRFSTKAMRMVLNLFFKEDYEEREAAILKITTAILNPDQNLIKCYASYSAETPMKRATFLKQMFAASRFKIPKELKCQLLILASKRDQLANYKCSVAISKHFERKVILHQTAGHDLPLDDPKWIIEQIKNLK